MKPKTIKILYWIFTLLLIGLMLSSASTELLMTEQAKMIMTQLEYPLYLNYILGVAKLLGIIGILQTKSPVLKEWAYAGFAIDLIGATASIAFAEGIGTSVFMLPFVVLLFLSYGLSKKLDSLKRKK